VPCKPLPKEDLDHVLTHTREHWGEARGQSFFITGGTGFFGIWLLESFAHVNDALALGMSATVLTRDPEVFAAKAPHLTSRDDLRFIRGDIQNFEFPQGTFEYIVHAATAASAKLNKENPLLMYDTITLGTRRLLEFAKHCNVKKLLLTSSGAVYGKQPPDMSHVSESYLGGPETIQCSSAYAEGKRAAEHMCILHAQTHGYECKIARCFAFVGPHLPLDAHFAIGNFIFDVLYSRSIAIRGDGTAIRSYLYASDLTCWLWTIMFKGTTLSAYNVGSEHGLSIMELAEVVKRCCQSAYEVNRKVKPSAKTSPDAYVPSTQLAQQNLHLSQLINLRESILKTYKWVSN
jgi:nucleoside-diphosphate-sugar epimerase